MELLLFGDRCYYRVLTTMSRYVEKFYAMRSNLQKISLRLQTYRTNEQMMQAMKGATMALGSMNRTMNLPSLQRIAMEFERENDIMEQRQEMMDDAIDDAMDVGIEEEGDEVVEQVLEEIGVDLSQAVRCLIFELIMAPSADKFFSSARHLQDYNPLPCQRAGLLRLLVVAAAVTLETTTSRHGWIV